MFMLCVCLFVCVLFSDVAMNLTIESPGSRNVGTSLRAGERRPHYPESARVEPRVVPTLT